MGDLRLLSKSDFMCAMVDIRAVVNFFGHTSSLCALIVSSFWNRRVFVQQNFTSSLLDKQKDRKAWFL